MAKRPGDPFRRADLFVVRIWRTSGGDMVDKDGAEEGPPGWQGRVQRALTGEAHHFQAGPP